MDVGPSTKAQFNFAWVNSMNSIIWNHGLYSCLLKIKKIKESHEIIRRNKENASQKEIWQQKVYLKTKIFIA